MFQYNADNPLVDEGVWREFAGSEFRISHISNDAFQKALAKYQQPHRKKLENRTLDPATNKQILCKAMADALLLDWRNVVDVNRQETKYTPKAGYEALVKNPAFRDFVTDVATELNNFVEEELEDVGNGFVSGPTGTDSGGHS